MTDATAWYVNERAEQFAIILLTRLKSLQVSRMAQDTGIDLQVSIDPHQSAGRLFGIQIKAAKKLSTLVNSNGMVKKDLASRLGESVRDYPFPVGLLVVDVVADNARFGWILKPEFDRILFTGHIHTDIVTTDLMERAVAEVRSWYKRRAVGS